MPVYETHIDIPVSREKAFAIISDFTNAARWDPRTVSARMVTDQGIGVGTRFELRGGLFTEDVIARFRIPKALATMPLPYDIVEFDPPKGFALEGRTPLVSYRDEIDFDETGEGTRVRYWAKLDLRGPLSVLEPAMRRTFDRIGDEATASIARIVAESG